MWRIRVTKCIHVLRTIIFSFLLAELVCYQSNLASFPRAALRNDFWLCDILTFGRVDLCFQNKSYQLRHKRSFIISYKTCRKTCVTNKGYFCFGLLGSGAPRKNVAFCVALSYTCVSPFFMIFCTVFPLTHSLFLLIQRECRITYSATGYTGYYAVAAMIEDFASPTDTQPLSGIPLQFLVYVFHSNEACDERPEFTEHTRSEGSCIGIPPGGTYFDRIIVRAGGPSKR